MTLMRFVGRAMLLSASAAVLSLALPSCSDPVPPAAQGAFTATFGNASDTSVVCPASPPNLSLGGVTQSERAPVVDGENGVSVQCRVVATSTGYFVDGSISDGYRDFSVRGDVNVGQAGTAQITLSGPNTTGTYRPMAGTTCNLTYKDGAPGRIWALFECPDMEHPGASNSTCRVYNGIFVFENCDSQ